MEEHKIEVKRRPWHWLKEIAGSIALIVIAIFMFSQIILITIFGAVYWYESKVWFLIGDFLVTLGLFWLGIDRLRDDLKR